MHVCMYVCMYAVPMQSLKIPSSARLIVTLPSSPRGYRNEGICKAVRVGAINISPLPRINTCIEDSLAYVCMYVCKFVCMYVLNVDNNLIGMYIVKEHHE